MNDAPSAHAYPDATTAPTTAEVRFDATGLVVAEDPDEPGAYNVPGGAGELGALRRSLPLSEALHARIRPVGTAETVLRDWVTGGPARAVTPWDDPAAVDPVRW